MIAAIIIIVLLGILDTMLFMACVSLEKDRTIEDEEQMMYLKEWREKRERSNSKADK